ncbi:MAG TPA: hypothetical protein VLY46_16300 [Usitatibacter sp.]|nr:hypothetical protein [Usitatibacter sp.]
MKALLMHPDRDFAPEKDASVHDKALLQDLEAETVLSAMAGEDELVYLVARTALLRGGANDVESVTYRQDALRDSLGNPGIVRGLYSLVIEALEMKRKHHFGIFSRYPAAVLHGAIDVLGMFMDMMARLREVARVQSDRFRSAAFTNLFAMIRREFRDEYFAEIRTHLEELRFDHGVLLSAGLGTGNDGRDYVLRLLRDKRPRWLRRLLGEGPQEYSFTLHPRDDAGAQILSKLRERGINEVANALAQSADHIQGFFEMLKTELAFHVGCINLHDRLEAIGCRSVFPEAQAAGTRRLRFGELYDVSLALRTGRMPVANGFDADGKTLAVITGANTGGKSTFLRSFGLAQAMMQSGMFVPAGSFAGELAPRVFTHFKREEDASMKSGKLDEELARMSGIVDALVPDSIVLFNESFAATNEREASEIATQVVEALLERRVRVFFVTHLYEFAHGCALRHAADGLFLRAERRPDGTRTFRLVEGEPLKTSYGEDLYRQVFGDDAAPTDLARRRIAGSGE